MADVRDWGKFVRGRWDWTAGGYERGFPRGCQITDIDAAVEFDGRSLVIEPKHWDGTGLIPTGPDVGQMCFLRDEVSRGKTAIVVWGCGPCNDPWAAKVLGVAKSDDEFHDWRCLADKNERRRMLKHLIDKAMGLIGDEVA